MSGEGGWLDELAVRATRGGFLRSLALAAGGLAFPLGRPQTGVAAADPAACRKGCFYAAHQKFLRTDAACEANLTQLGIGTATFVLLWGNPFYTLAVEGGAMIRSVSCTERARLTQKAAQWDCMQPDCPGFDPLRADGPCANCRDGCKCCPDQAVQGGYSPCTAGGGCCNPSGDGCASGVTACG
jgi:hypothetical protein